MKKEDIDFLKKLQHEMLTQDTVGQANPRFWVVMQEVRHYWVNDNADGIFINKDGECVFEGVLNELAEWLKELDGIESCTFDACSIDFIYNDEEYCIMDSSDLQVFLEDYDSDCYDVGEYRNRDEIVQNTMFLTLRECKEHIKGNKHNYNSPYPYAMTAFRSPQVERLYKILENTNWDGVISED